MLEPEREGAGLFSAAAVIPRRADGCVLVGRRTPKARSYPDYTAFPGGGMDARDRELPLLSGETFERAERACAIRELGEETGRWLLVDGEGCRARPEAFARFEEGLRRQAPIAEVLAACGLLLDDRELISLGRWYTADGRPRQFGVRQFLLPFDDEGVLRSAPVDELTDIEWMSPEALRQAWSTGDVLLLPPIRHVVMTLERHARAPFDDLAAALRQVPAKDAPRLRDIVEGIALEPYRTPTLPPATHTNTVLVGTGDFFIIDPASPYPEERASFDQLLADLAGEGRRPRAVLLTHHHVDHASDAARVHERYGLEVWAHPETAARVDVPVARKLVGGEVLEAPGPAPRALEVIFTPGHAPGHLAFFERHTSVLIAGDMIAGVGSILIDPPEGHMGTYLASLERLKATLARRVVPSHGPLLADAQERLQQHIDHRRLRQVQVAQALSAAGRAVTPRELVPGIYGADTPEAMYPLAARSVLAALELLVEEGAAREESGRFVVA